jgi:hypothetical protein
MKNFILLLFAFALTTSCDITEDDRPNFHYEILAVEDFEIPDTFDYLSTHEIKLYYKLPSNCHTFGGIYFERFLNERTVGIQSIVTNRANCLANEDEMLETSFNFEVISKENYLFKFYKGKDANGNNIFEEVEIPVNSD